MRDISIATKKVKMVRVGVSLSLIAYQVKFGTMQCSSSGIPEDAQLEGQAVDSESGVIWCFFSHDSFAPVAVGDPIPILSVTFSAGLGGNNSI